MKKFNLKKLAVMCALLSVGATVNAQQPSEVTTTATLQISNGFALAEDAALTFGSIRASQSLGEDTLSGEGAGLRVVPNVATPETIAKSAFVDGSDGVDNTSSVMTSLVAGTPGQYTVTGAAPGANMNIILPDVFSLTDGVTAAFNVTIAASDVIIASGPNINATYDSVNPNAQTDGAGAVSFFVGGEITIDPNINANIDDGNYTGAYAITVSY